MFARVYPPVRELVHGQLQHDFRKHHRWILPLFSTGDIVQEVFLGVLDQGGLDGFRGANEAELIQYLGAVVRHRLVDAMRYHEASRRDARRRAESGDDERTAAVAAAPAADPTPSLAAELGEQLAAYRAVLDRMPDKARQILTLRLEGEESFAHIAELCGLPTADAARQAFRSAKARLLVRLQARGVHAEQPRAEDGS